MEVTLATFHSFGNLPKMRERLKSFVMAGAILYAVDLSILADILSGPLALEGSMVERRYVTSSTVHRRPSGMSLESVVRTLPGKRGGSQLLKLCEEWLFKS